MEDRLICGFKVILIHSYCMPGIAAVRLVSLADIVHRKVTGKFWFKIFFPQEELLILLH